MLAAAGLVLVFLGSAFAEAQLLEKRPPWLLHCRRNDPEINECIVRLLNNMFPYMAKGIPEIEMDRFEPLFINKISLSKGHGPVTIAGSFSNILVQGPSKAVTESVRIETDKQEFNFTLVLPELRMKARYNLKGHILVLPLIGDGDATLRLRNATSIIKNTYELIQYNGREVMQFNDMTVDFRINKTDIHLENLFNGNKVLGQTLNNFLNKNMDEVLNELHDSLSESLSSVFKNIFNKSFKYLPTDLWFSKE